MKNEFGPFTAKHPGLAIAAGLLAVDGMLFGGQIIAGENPCESASNQAVGWVTAPQCSAALEVGNFISNPTDPMPDKVAGMHWNTPTEPAGNVFDSGLRSITQPIR